MGIGVGFGFWEEWMEGGRKDVPGRLGHGERCDTLSKRNGMRELV